MARLEHKLFNWSRPWRRLSGDRQQPTELQSLAAAEQELMEQIGNISALEKQLSDSLARQEAELKGFETQIRDWLGIDEQYSERIAGLSQEKQALNSA